MLTMMDGRLAELFEADFPLNIPIDKCGSSFRIRSAKLITKLKE